VLGMTMVDIGRLIARRWGLPRDLIESLHDVTPQAGEPLDHAGWLAALSTMSSTCARAICEEDAGDEALAGIVEGYADMLGMECGTVLEAVGAARVAARDDPALTRPTAVTASAAPVNMEREDATPALVRGVADMRRVAASITTGQLMTIALETIFLNLKLTRAVAFLRNRKDGKYVAGMCFGADVQALASRLVFSDAYQPDVFHAALANDKMVCVKDASDPAFRAKLPRWWKDAFPAVRSFIVLPLTVNRHPVGFIYGDWDDAAPVALAQSEIQALNELRSLVMGKQGG
jgi:hypothetical protein